MNQPPPSRSTSRAARWQRSIYQRRFPIYLPACRLTRESLDPLPRLTPGARFTPPAIELDLAPGFEAAGEALDRAVDDYRIRRQAFAASILRRPDPDAESRLTIIDDAVRELLYRAGTACGGGTNRHAAEAAEKLLRILEDQRSLAIGPENHAFLDAVWPFFPALERLHDAAIFRVIRDPDAFRDRVIVAFQRPQPLPNAVPHRASFGPQ